MKLNFKKTPLYAKKATVHILVGVTQGSTKWGVGEEWPPQWRISVIWLFFIWKLKFIFKKNSNVQITCTFYKFTKMRESLYSFNFVFLFFFMCLIKGMVFFDRCLIFFQCKNRWKKHRSWIIILVSSLILRTLKKIAPCLSNLKNGKP